MKALGVGVEDFFWGGMVVCIYTAQLGGKDQ
jgi:hypothetical protein